MLVPTGPLTNVALMLERHPDVRDRLERIVWMGGAIGEGNVTPAAEFNAFVDPEAAAAVFGSGIPVTLIGLDITHKALFTPAHADRLRDTGAAGRAVAELSDFFQRFHESRYAFDGSPIHDALAVAHVIDPTLVTTVNCNIAIETASQYCDGRTVVDRWQVLQDAPRNADAGIDVDAQRFLELLVERIGSLAVREGARPARANRAFMPRKKRKSTLRRKPSARRKKAAPKTAVLAELRASRALGPRARRARALPRQRPLRRLERRLRRRRARRRARCADRRRVVGHARRARRRRRADGRRAARSSTCAPSAWGSASSSAG